MIDTLYQDQINKNLDDQVQRPTALPPQQPSTFTGFWRGLGGLPAGIADGFGTASDITQGTANVEASQGLVWNPGTRTYTQLSMDDSSRALAEKMRTGHTADLFTSEAGDTFRTVAKDYMPDPKTTGAAGQILGHGFHFMGQAAPTMAVGGPLLGPAGVGAFSGMQEADRLREQGVDQTTREKAGLAVGAGSAAAMVLPMSGPTALMRFTKGAVGGAVSSAAQTEAEKLILQHAGYDKLAAQYDPLDPTNLAISALVPGVLGAAMGHGAAAPRDVPLPDGVHPDTSGDAANLRLDNDIAAVNREIARKDTTPEQRQVLQAELDKLTEQRRAGAVKGAIAADPNLEAAARVNQVARALDDSRLTPDEDLVGRDMHQQALERAFDQLGAGEPVNVSDLIGDRLLPGMREARAVADHIDQLEAQRAQLLGDAGNQLAPGEAAALHQQVAELQSQLTDAGPAAVKARAKELQGQDVSFKQAAARAQRELSDKLADQQATLDRLQKQLQQHATGAQAAERISLVERDLAAAREKQSGLTGPATTPRRLALAMQEVYRELGRTPAVERTRANPDAFHAARAEAEGEAAAPPARDSGAAPAPAARETPAAPAARASAATAGPTDAHLDAAVSQLDPDMLVHVEGMDQPMRLADLMEHVREEAAREGKDARLLEVAAQCAISVGAAG